MVTCWDCWPASGSAVGLDELSCVVPWLLLSEDEEEDGELDEGAGALPLWPPLGSTCTWTGGCVGAGRRRGLGGSDVLDAEDRRADAGNRDLIGRRAGRHIDRHGHLRAADEGDEEGALLGRGRHGRGAETRQEEACRRETDEQLALVHAKTRRPWDARRRDPSMGHSGGASDVFGSF